MASLVLHRSSLAGMAVVATILALLFAAPAERASAAREPILAVNIHSYETLEACLVSDVEYGGPYNGSCASEVAPHNLWDYVPVGEFAYLIRGQGGCLSDHLDPEYPDWVRFEACSFDKPSQRFHRSAMGSTIVQESSGWCLSLGERVYVEVRPCDGSKSQDWNYSCTIPCLTSASSRRDGRIG